jgi:hypothetical protein
LIPKAGGPRGDSGYSSVGLTEMANSAHVVGWGADPLGCNEGPRYRMPGRPDPHENRRDLVCRHRTELRSRP